MAIDFPSSPTQGQLYSYGGVTYTYTAQGVWVTAGASAVGIIGGSPQGRLTLQTATPVMTTTQSAKTTIYYTPYVGNRVPLYDGTNMVMTTFAELSVATTDTTKSPAAIGASKVNDWFVWNDAGTVRLGHGPDWTSDTVRSAGTALVLVNGIWLNNAAITNGPAASRGTYVGTTRSNASSQLDWIYGTVVANGGPAFLGVWNVYNRVNVSTMVGDQTTTWTYGTAAWRQLHGTAGNQVGFISGLNEDVMSCQYAGLASAGSPGSYVQGIGLDVFTAFVGTTAHSALTNNAPYIATYSGMHLGWHIVAPIEEQLSGGTSTIFGGGAAVTQQGFIFQFRM